MNHEWNPITTAPYREPIMVTDGESVWFGRLTRSGFVGSDLLDGDIVSIPNKDTLTGWLPAPAPKTMWEPQESGEAMLWRLGYYPHPEIKNHYKHAEEDVSITSITIEDDGVWFESENCRYKVGIYEILAVAQLIKETEV